MKRHLSAVIRNLQTRGEHQLAAELKSLLHGDFSRLAAELYILKKKGFAESRYQGLGTDNAGLLARLTTNPGTRYTLWVELHNFPDGLPSVYVVDPVLKTRDGGEFTDAFRFTGNMHVLGSKFGKYPELCLFHAEHWTSRNTLYIALLKARMWLEAYETYLASGKKLGSLLPHGS